MIGRARRDLDKNSFESIEYNFRFFYFEYRAIVIPLLANNHKHFAIGGKKLTIPTRSFLIAFLIVPCRDQSYNSLQIILQRCRLLPY
jgi:hypothetical protein